jgi:hypothetical protein
VALDSKKEAMASSAVVSARPSSSVSSSLYPNLYANPNSIQLSFWWILFIIVTSILVLSLVGFIFMYRKLPKLPRFAKLRNFKRRSGGSYNAESGSEECEDPESAPLLLNDRDREDH